MTGREKAIVVAAGIALLWGGISLVQERAGSARREAAGPSGLVASEAFRTASEAQLLRVKLTPTERQVLLGARAPWQAGLFRRVVSSHVVSGAEEAIHLRQMHVYSGYAVVGDERYAVINGRAYRVEETLENDTAVLHQVDPEYAALRFPQDGSVKIIPFEGMERERK